MIVPAVVVLLLVAILSTDCLRCVGWYEHRHSQEQEGDDDNDDERNHGKEYRQRNNDMQQK